jgi:hypothetical protein
VRGQLIEVDMTAGETSYRLLEGRGLLIFEGDTPIRLTPAPAETPLAIAA